jgi:hypothetical protein
MSDPQTFAAGAFVGCALTAAAMVRIGARLYGTRGTRPTK